MELIIKIITLAIGVLNFIGILFVGIHHKLASDKLVGNDLTHLAIGVNDIKEEQKCMKTELINQGKLIAQIDSRCNERVTCK